VGPRVRARRLADDRAGPEPRAKVRDARVPRGFSPDPQKKNISRYFIKIDAPHRRKRAAEPDPPREAGPPAKRAAGLDALAAVCDTIGAGAADLGALAASAPAPAGFVVLPSSSSSDDDDDDEAAAAEEDDEEPPSPELPPSPPTKVAAVTVVDGIVIEARSPPAPAPRSLALHPAALEFAHALAGLEAFPALGASATAAV